MLLATVSAIAIAQTTQTRTLGKIMPIEQAPEPQSDFLNTSLGVGPHSIRPLLLGSTVPKFKVIGVTGNSVMFNPQHLKKPLVITFFMGGWCPYCVTQFSRLRDIEPDLLALGFDIWFISPDQPDLVSFGDQGREGAYQLFSDSDFSAAKAFGIAYKVKQSVLDLHFDGGAFLTKYSGRDHNLLPVPSSFIISTEGKVVFQYSNPDHTQRIQPELLLAAAGVSSK